MAFVQEKVNSYRPGDNRHDDFCTWGARLPYRALLYRYEQTGDRRFLDAGGGANEDMVAAGFSLMLEDPNVKGVLINIFGGILRCDIVAQGVVNAAKRTGMTLPLVIRMEGTNVEEGRRILKESGLNYHPAASMSEAARKIAEITGRA